MKWIKKVAVTVLDNIAGAIIDSTNIADETTNTYSARIIKQLIEDSSNNTDIILKTIDLIYPVGRGFIDFTDTDYSNWLGLTWERELIGMFPVGYNPNDTSFDSIGKKGGEKEHTLTQAELPNYTLYNSAHNHAIYSGWGEEQDGNSSDVYRFQRWALNGRDWRYGSLGTSSDTIKVDSGGGNQAHNNLPPYQVVSYWKRVDPNATISFKIDGTEYQAKPNMTWQQWLDSEYNTDKYYYDSDLDLIRTKDGNDQIDYADINAIIVANKDYSISMAPW